MNKELKDREFIIPQHILDSIQKQIKLLNSQHANGLERAQKLLKDKKVKYGQLKRIIHDLTYLDKNTEIVKYNLAGGNEMLDWGKKFLTGERKMISDRKESKKNSDEIGGMTGERKNSHLKKHTKKFNFNLPVNLIKSNSHKTSVTSLKLTKLFEEINKIKKLINH